MHKKIESIHNPLIKQVSGLIEKSRKRKQLGLFVIEGKRELSLAIKANYQITSLFYFPDLFSSTEAEALSHYDIEIIEISKEVFQKLAYRESTEGVIALAITKPMELDRLRLSEKPLILVAEAPEKPGNIGALLRTADAANLDAVIIANPKTDLFNPNIIRSSVGCVFTNQIATGTTSEIIQFLKQKHINIFCAELKASELYADQDYNQASAIVVGTEATGLSEEAFGFNGGFAQNPDCFSIRTAIN